jgi:cation:H+ antiporter
VIPVLAFFASGGVVVLAGVALARYADEIAEATGLGRVWIGSVLLAAATSLPEAATDVAAVRLGVPDLAAGDLFGSSMANMLILGIVDLLPPRVQVLRRAALDHALSAALAIVLNALAALFVLLQPTATVFGIGVETVSLLLVYLAGTRAVYRHNVRARPLPRETSGHRLARLSSARAAVGFGVAAVAILVAAPFFAWSAQRIAEMTGLGTTFVGTWLVGFSTSLPELVASVAAVRAGALDLAVGNLFGSNALNMGLFFALNAAQPGQAFFAGLDVDHALSGLLAVVLTSLGLAAVVYGAERRYAMIEPDSALIVLTYFLSLWLLYTRAVMP